MLLGRDPRLGAQSARALEYQVKAVFLFNFAQFVGWPAGAFADSMAPMVIGVLGNDPFGSYLDETVRGEKVHRHSLEVRRYRKIEEITTCHILFINPSGERRLEEVLSNLKNRAILTVGDDPGFAQRGGMIRFVSEKSKIRMRINVAAASAVNLTISSKLLRAAEIVTQGTP
jgi:uncharacterized protein DUF4154